MYYSTSNSNPLLESIKPWYNIIHTIDFKNSCIFFQNVDPFNLNFILKETTKDELDYNTEWCQTKIMMLAPLAFEQALKLNYFNDNSLAWS